MGEPSETVSQGASVAEARMATSTAHTSRHGPHVAPGVENRTEMSGGKRPRRSMRWVVVAIVGGVAAAVGVWKGGPWARAYFSRVSTDDAFVAGDATTVASRLADVVEEVLVHNDDYVDRGKLLVRLDQRPLQIAVDQARADLRQAELNVDRLVKSLATSRAQWEQARDQVRSSALALEEAWRVVETQQQQVRSRIAGLRSQAASLRASYAELVLAQKDHARVKNLVASQTATREELDQKLAALDSAREKYKVAEQSVQQARAVLGLAPDYQYPERIPADLERTDTEVRRAVAAGQQILANLGLAAGLHRVEPEALLAALHHVADGSAESWFDEVPSIRSARSQVDQAIAMLGGPSFDPSRPYAHPSVARARKDLEEAELRFSYTEIRAPVTGFINRRSVNPGDHVQTGQGLMSIQPLDAVYVEANFKETQLSALTIGLPASIWVDAYPGHVVRGRLSGFAPATGAASSMLPPENATGNFVKVTQRIPVRIDLIEPNPCQTPLLVGMSVIPEIDIKAQPDGPDAGNRLRASKQESHP